MTISAPAAASLPAGDPPGRFFWARPHADGRPDGAVLAALRRGAGREAGTVPPMWRYYTTLNRGGTLTPALRAEHVALVLFAVHQQSQSTLVHASGISIGTALAGLRESGKFSPEAVDRRFAAAATATSLNEAAHHLRGLVRQMRSLSPAQQLDYTALVWNLVDWQNPAKVGQIRRRWGADYLRARDKKPDLETPATH
ncbi:type I-E CRISPR-associated protein Cse2/CasB [Frankia sp. R82]|uniref:type I-E CRISPR-associated protein Cse2/CasB n=1 Tax=Frankia sp. R82 TaxID=2950553 RepID=UPI0020444F8F|nr:type I-E CRISPR-associated protein Cse2/CasB [Frankia sp. R82]MCM3884611.1 type I-E CRISPR-associated protein Cse2/CasB [Frankia sp. R82]